MLALRKTATGFGLEFQDVPDAPLQDRGSDRRESADRRDQPSRRSEQDPG